MDGDRYHKGLALRYQLLYKQIGQQRFDSQELAHNALRPLLKDVRQYGEPVLVWLTDAADIIAQRLALPMVRALTDCDALKQELERMLQPLQAHTRGKEFALLACERYLNDVSLMTDVGRARQEIITGYFMIAYTANFESPAQTSPRTTRFNLSHAQIVEQLPSIRAHVEIYTRQMAERMARSPWLGRVALPTAPRASQVVGLGEFLS
ncbi:MAG: hypothetical protein RLZZ387_2535 [Chloroflexota bacterium]|jgi:hypothetical protein